MASLDPFSPQAAGAGAGRLQTWQRQELEGFEVLPRDHLHVTPAFLGGRPPATSTRSSRLRETAAAIRPFELEAFRYRETRSVAMLVLADPSGEAGLLAGLLQGRLEALGVYERERRPWLPHVTALRFRSPPQLSPPLPPVGRFAPSEDAAFLARLHPSGARYEVLDAVSLGGWRNEPRGCSR